MSESDCNDAGGSVDGNCAAGKNTNHYHFYTPPELIFGFLGS